MSLTVFLNQIQNLMDDLLLIFPDEKDIRLSNEKFKIVRQVNPKMVMEGFVKYVYPYKDYITAEDEDFFLFNPINSNVAEGLTGDLKTKKEFILTKSLGLKELWKTDMNEHNKATIWKYFQILIKLSEQYIIAHANLH